MNYERESLGPVQQWVVFLRAMEARFAREAAAHGGSIVPLTDEDCWAAARVAALCGLQPGDPSAVALTPIDERQPVSAGQ